MRLVISVLAVTILLLVNPVFGAKKDKSQQRDWQTGKVLDLQRSEQYAGTVERPGVIINGRRWTNDSTRAVYVQQETLVIEGETHTYTASFVPWRRGKWGRRWKPANLTVNGPVKFAVEGQALYFTDEDGNEYQSEILKKVLRTPEQAK